MFDLKDAEIKDEEAEMILQNRKWCHCVPRLLANLIRENKMVAICLATKYIKVFHGLSTMITWAQQQRNATATQFDSSDFFVRRPEEYEGPAPGRNFSCSNYEKFEESYWSYAQEVNLIGYLHQLLGILNELRCHRKVGRPRFLVKFPTFLGKVLTVVFQLRRSLLSL